MVQNIQVIENTKQVVTYIDAHESKNEKTRIAGYCRVSSGLEDQLNSFTNQVGYYQKITEYHPDWELVDVYADEAKSGVSTKNRDEFNRMITDCQNGKIDKIVTKSVSRFARNTMDTISTVRKLREYGVSVLFESENLDTSTITSEQILSIQAHIAEQESLRMSKNLQHSIRTDMQRGIYLPTSVAYGYKLKDKQHQICEEEAKIVKIIYKEYLGGKGGHLIASILNDQGIPNKLNNGTWDRKSVLNVIRNQCYVGDLLLQKTFRNNDLTHKDNINKGELPQYLIKNAHEPIVNRITWKLANILLDERGKNKIVINQIQSPFNNKIKCCCGTSYRKKTINDTLYWVCRTYSDDKTLCNVGSAVKDIDIRNTFMKMYNKLRFNEEKLLLPLQASLKKLEASTIENSMDLMSINSELANLLKQSEMLNKLVYDGVLDQTVFTMQNDALTQKINMIKKQKQVLTSKQNQQSLLPQNTKLLKIIEKLPKKIIEFDDEVFTSTIKTITIDENMLVFELVNGLKLRERIKK